MLSRFASANALPTLACRAASVDCKDEAPSRGIWWNPMTDVGEAGEVREAHVWASPRYAMFGKPSARGSAGLNRRPVKGHPCMIKATSSGGEDGDDVDDVSNVAQLDKFCR